MTGEGVRFNPDSYESALDGAYVALPNDITAGMSNLTVDYDVWVDPANVGEHQMWGFGRKSGSCDVDTGAEGSIFASNTQRFRVAVGPANLQQNRVRMLEGAWTHVTYTQSLNSNGTSWTGRLYLDGVLHATSTNLTTAPSVNAAGTNCNFLGRSQTSGHYSFRGTIRDFRVYDRAVQSRRDTRPGREDRLRRRSRRRRGHRPRPDQCGRTRHRSAQGGLRGGLGHHLE